ncbi:MAG: hypothetical protein PHU36_07995, partial [Syntrophomonadaceae bacterium]|nr:hypothetical protein [Syntrophomonadaceae bacterium]
MSNAVTSGSVVTVTCGTNNSTSSLTGTVTVQYGTVSSSVNVTQAASSPYITLIPDTLNFSSSGGVRVLAFLTNVAGPDVSFSGCVDYAVQVAAVIVVTCEANNTISERT